MLPAESPHRISLIDSLTNEIREVAENETLSLHDSAARVLLTWLDYDPQQVVFAGNADGGVDAWFIADANQSGGAAIDVFQIKTHDLSPEGLLQLARFDNAGVNDLIRAKKLLLHNDGTQNGLNRSVKDLLAHFAYASRSRELQADGDPILVTLNLVVLGDGLTEAAQAEFDRFRADSESLVKLNNGVSVQFAPVLYTVNEVLNARWRETNREWKDPLGNKVDRIQLRPLDEDNFISDRKNAVFYCMAIDLVSAYETLGYQLFEPNVRAHIRKSRVNQAIRDSVKYYQTRKDFRFLNNGVTITCKGYRKPRGQNPEFVIRYPGVVNGLQTVVALHTAYHELNSEKERRDFEENCAVLVRILRENAVNDITRVVRATNNQNPMQPRNLVSNNQEQMIYARVFAEDLGWFYEAKQGAWEAFEKDYKRWRPPLNRHPDDFRPVKSRKSKVRRVDNHTLAQTWFSFLGFMRVAANEKKRLFDDPYYEFIFLMRPVAHGYDYNYKW